MHTMGIMNKMLGKSGKIIVFGCVLSSMVAASGAVVVFGDDGGVPCLINGQPVAPEVAEANPEQCDAGTGPAAGGDAPVAEEPPAPVEVVDPPVEEPAPVDPPADPAPEEPAPADEPVPADDPAPADEPADNGGSTPPPAPSNGGSAPTKPKASQPAAAPVARTVNRARATALAKPKFVDARVFRDNFTPTGRIPEMKPLETSQMEMVADATVGSAASWNVVIAVAWMDSQWGNKVAGSFIGSRFSTAEWNTYKTDGNSDGVVDRASAEDQVATTVAYFNAHSTELGVRPALVKYFDRNPAQVQKALRLSSFYKAYGKAALVDGLDDAAAQREIIERVLDNERVDIYDGGRSDIDFGLIDPRVLVTMEFIANRYGQIGVTSLVTGHSVFTTSGNVSLHSMGQAMDIATVSDISINGHQQRNSITTKVLRDILLMPKSMQPAELISLWDLGGPSFALSDHADHIHIGFKREHSEVAGSGH